MKNKIFLFSLIVFSAFVGAAVVYVFVDKAAHDHVEKKRNVPLPHAPRYNSRSFWDLPSLWYGFGFGERRECFEW